MKLVRLIARLGQRAAGYRAARLARLQKQRLERINDDLARARKPVIFWRARS